MENKNQIVTAVTFSAKADGKVPEEPRMLIKKSRIINTIKDIRIEA